MDASQPAAPDAFGFADMLAPLTREEFYSEVRGSLPVHVEGTPEKFAFAMNWDELNRILDQTAIWTPHTLGLVLDKVAVPAEQYVRDGIGRDGRPARLVDFERVRALVRKGASIVLNDIETLTPGMKRIADILSVDPGGRVQGNLYCSWQRRQAFDVHYDTHDVFAMQVTGEKLWRIYQRHFKDPINHPAFKQIPQSFHDSHKGALLMEFTMRPGDLVYIPRGFYHEALAKSDATVHMSFSVVSMIGLDVISLLFEHAVGDEIFRAGLPHPSERDGKALEEHLTRIAGRMREQLRDPKIRAQIAQAIRDFRYSTAGITLPDDAAGD